MGTIQLIKTRSDSSSYAQEKCSSKGDDGLPGLTELNGDSLHGVDDSIYDCSQNRSNACTSVGAEGQSHRGDNTRRDRHVFKGRNTCAFRAQTAQGRESL